VSSSGVMESQLQRLILHGYMPVQFALRTKFAGLRIRIARRCSA
jgi:hypothetical protein